MDAASFAQVSHQGFLPNNGLGMPTSGLASRRGGQNIKPLSFDALKSPSAERDNGAPTPRTSRSHLLAGLRTAPKTSTAATFANNPASPTTGVAPSLRSRNPAAGAMYNDNLYSGPKTSLPRFSAPQQQNYNQQMSYGQQYTADQVLAPPEIQVEEQGHDHLDPTYHAQLLAANAYLSQQQQRLQQQLLSLQAAAQNMNLSNQIPMMQQAYQNLYQQQQLKNLQPMVSSAVQQPSIYTVYDPITGQQSYYVDQSQQLPQLNAQFVDQAQFNPYVAQQQPQQAPRVQVSPPPAEGNRAGLRNTSPPRRFESPAENVTPLPPPSANAFRRGHKKSTSLANGNKGPLAIATEEPPKSAGPRTANFPLTPLTATGSYGPGQARAGEHPVRQPRGPPSFDELASKPTAKHEGSKNFVTRTRRSAVTNLVRAGLERRKEARSSGSISPISESTEELVETPMTDNESDSGRSGSGSLVGDNDDAECSLPSSRTSTGSWGAIGSDRPSSRQKTGRESVDSTASDNENGPGSSFASLLKNSNRLNKAEGEGQRKAPMLVLTSAEKRKTVV